MWFRRDGYGGGYGDDAGNRGGCGSGCFWRSSAAEAASSHFLAPHDRSLAATERGMQRTDTMGASYRSQHCHGSSQVCRCASCWEFVVWSCIFKRFFWNVQAIGLQFNEGWDLWVNSRGFGGWIARNGVFANDTMYFGHHSVLGLVCNPHH